MQTAAKIETALPPDAESETLRALRRIAGQSRLTRFQDPEAACNLLQTQPAAAAEAYGAALLRLLPKAMGRRVVFHRPGAGPCSFDEAWLLALLRAVRRGDQDSLHFALASRVERRFHAPIKFLVDGLARRIDSLAGDTM